MRIKLDDIEKKIPYEVPDDYFLNLTADIQSKISTKSKIEIIPKWALRLAFVPALLLMVFIGYKVYDSNDVSIPQSEILLANIPDEDIISYLDQEELSLNDLMAMTTDFSDLLDEDPDYLQGLDLEGENIDDLLNTYDLKEI